MIDLAAKPFYLKPEDIEWVNTTLAGMTTEEKAGQLFCVLFKECKPEEFEYVFNILKPGGCMYRVVPTERAIAATQNIYSRSKVPPLIAANLEKGGNGIVTEGTLVGAPMEIAATDDIGMATKMAHACAAEASAVGANWAFAPIIDIDTNYRNPITNTRTFGSDPERVRRMGRAYVEEVQKMGLAASIKHFPGDGQDERDQHLVTSINNMDCDPWMNTYGAAYKAGIEAGALTAMVGHIMQPAWTRRLNPGIKDEDIMPGTLSREMMQGLLRGELGFNGLICTDATTMAGYTLAMSRRRAVPESIARGADMFLFARNLEEDYGFMLQGIKDGIITPERLDEAVTRILAIWNAGKRSEDNYLPEGVNSRMASVSPLWDSDFSGLPRTLLITAQYDYLTSQAKTYAHYLAAAHVPVTWVNYCSVGHAFVDKCGVYPQADDSLKMAAEFVR